MRHWIPLSVVVWLVTMPPIATSGEPTTKTPEPVKVVTDGEWKASETEQVGWETREFHDKDWAPAASIAGPAEAGKAHELNQVFCVTASPSYIWSKGDGRRCYLRRSFPVPKAIQSAELMWVADDTGQLYLNGRQLGIYDSGNSAYGHRGSGAIIDLIPHLLAGQTNTLAIVTEDTGGYKGVACEVRINVAPFFPRALLFETEKPTPAERSAITANIAALGSKGYADRDRATKELLAAAKRHREHVRGDLEAALECGNPEVVWRAEKAVAASRFDLKAALTAAGLDGEYWTTWAIPDDAELTQLLTAEEGKNPLGFRFLVQAYLHLQERPNAFEKLVRQLARSKDEHQLTVLATYIGTLERTGLADVLDDMLTRQPPGRATTAAAVALGKLDPKAAPPHRVKLLKAAAGGPHEPTARAAAWALGRLEAK